MTDERLVHRLEAFSDVVIGFVLAEMAITLSIPRTMPSPGDLVQNMVAFASTFFLVVIIWYLHNRLFAAYFVPNFAMIALNFTMLGGLIVMGYLFAVAMRFSDQSGWLQLLALWFAGFALVYFLIGVMYSLGTYLRSRELDARTFAAGVVRAISCVLGAAVLLVIALYVSHAQHMREIHGIFYLAFALSIVTFLLRRFGTPWLAARRAAADSRA